jgi:hypothetical protein
MKIKILLTVLLFLVFLGTTAQTTIDENGQLVLGEPVPYPSNFGELYCLVEGCEGIPAHPAWRFKPCEVTGSQLHWDSAVRLFTGTPDWLERQGFLLLTAMFFEQWYDVCGDAEGKPILFGKGVDEFFKWYSAPESYDFAVVGDFFNGVATAMERMNLEDE